MDNWNEHKWVRVDGSLEHTSKGPCLWIIGTLTREGIRWEEKKKRLEQKAN